MTRSFTRFVGLPALMTLLLPHLSEAQNLTQADFTGVLVPQYLSNGNNSGSATGSSAYPGPRLAVVFRATLTNLTPATAYRYYVQAATASEIGGTASGAGIVLLITPGTTAATTTYLTASTGSLSTDGQYATFTTDAAGGFTGWFGLVNSNNATRFQTAGTVLLPTITLAPAATPATITRRALNQGLTVLAFNAAAGASNGTLLTGSSAATPKNLVFTYDNAAGTGRPLSGALVENTEIATGTTQTGPNAYTYSTTNGAYTTVVPNTLPSGVRRVEQRSVVTGSLVGSAIDADGTWPSGANTANPAGGAAAPLVLTATDTPLNAVVSATTRAGQALPGLMVFPNPTRGQLTLSLPKAGAARVALRELTGRLVLASAALPASGQLRLPATLAAGTYLLEVQQGAERAVRRVMVE